MSAYDALAGAYDALMEDGAYRRRADWLERRLRAGKRPARTVLDLGCGTGTIACMLAQRGFQVTATDLSEEMLTQAAAKAAELPEELRPLFVHQSMPRLRLPEPVDAVISTLDSLNYLTRSAELRETMRRVGEALAPGGWFLFDVNTPYKLRRMDGQIYLDETEDTYCVWRTGFSRRTRCCTYWVDLFRLRPDGGWDRSEEAHRERAWEEEELRDALREAGFAKILLTGDLRRTPPPPDEDRWNFRCQKPF